MRFPPYNLNTTEAQNALATYPMGCDFLNTPEEEWACLPNSLSCLKSEADEYCDVAVGWCLPKNEVESIQQQATTIPPTFQPTYRPTYQPTYQPTYPPIL